MGEKRVKNTLSKIKKQHKDSIMHLFKIYSTWVIVCKSMNWLLREWRTTWPRGTIPVPSSIQAPRGPSGAPWRCSSVQGASGASPLQPCTPWGTDPTGTALPEPWGMMARLCQGLRAPLNPLLHQAHVVSWTKNPNSYMQYKLADLNILCSHCRAAWISVTAWVWHEATGNSKSTVCDWQKNFSSLLVMVRQN